MLSWIFYAIVTFLKYIAVVLYMLGIALFVIYGMAFAQAYLTN